MYGASTQEPDDPCPLEALLAEADESMYEKKRSRQGVIKPQMCTSADRVEFPAFASSPDSLLK